MPPGTARNEPIISDDKPMAEEHRKVLRRCREKLVKDMEPAEVLLQMAESLVFTQEDEDKIKSRDLTRQQQCETLLDILPRKGAKAYEIFKKTIERVHPHLTSTVYEAEITELTSELNIEREGSADLRRRLNTKGKQTCSRCSGLEHRLVRLGWDRDDKIKNWQDDIEKYKKENRKSADLIRKLMGEKRTLKDENDDLRAKVGNITKECEEIKDKYDQLVEEARNNSTEMKRLNEEMNKTRSTCETLQNQIIERRSFVCRVFIPKGEAFHSDGVIFNLRNDKSANVVATRSSEGPGEANDVLDRRGGKTCGTAEIRGSWWCVDIGENHLLFPTHYSLRHGKKEGDSVLRSWQLEGSIDGEDWKIIDTHKKKCDTRELAEPFPYAKGTWSVEGEIGAFRYFKIVQTGQNSSNNYGIYLSGMEFYGVLLKV